MILHALGNQASVTSFIDFLGIAEPDHVVGGVPVGVLHGVIQKTSRQAQREDWVLLRLI